MSTDTIGGLVILGLLVVVGLIPLAVLRYRRTRVEEAPTCIPPHALHQLNQRINMERTMNPDRQS